MASKVSKGTVVDSTSAYLAAEAQKHLPSVDVVGTFSYGKRVTTPSGKPMIPIRPASALAARVRGVSAGAEEARPQRDILLERSRNTKPNESAVRDVEVWIATAQQDAKRLPPGVVSPRIEGSLVEAQAVATPHMLRHRWRSRLLSTVRNRALYPSATVLLPDVAQRGPLDRLATLLHAAGQFKLKVDADTPPTLVIPATVNAKASVVTADTAEVLFGSNLRIQGGSDVIVGSDMNARHVVLAVGTHFYQLDLLHPSGELLCATEIKARIVAAVEHAACSPHPHEFLGRLSAVSRSDKAVLEDITTSLSSACLANQRSLRALNSAWLVVSLLPDADADDTLVVPPTSAAWTGASLQLVMHPSGVSSLTANTMFVDTTTLLVFAQHISHAANTDPMLSAPLAPVPHDVAAMKRVPLSQVRPTTAGKPGAKGAAAVAVVAQSDDGNLDETATVLEVSIPAPPRAQVLVPLPLWLPVSLASTILAVGVQNPVATSCFEVPVTFSGVMEVACILAVDAALRSEGDDLPPLVRVARSTATSCPDEVTVFSDAVHNALNVLKPLLRGAKDRSVDEFLFKRDRRQVQSALRAAIAATSSAICASSSERTAAIGVGQLLPVARTLSSSGYLPGAPSLRHRGEACAPADVLVFHHTLTPSHHGLTSVVERSSLGPESARFSLSYCETHEAGTWSCVLSHRRDDQRTASAYVDAAMTAYSAIQRILLGDP